MKRQYLNESWNDYANKVLPKDAPPIQRKECRMAFLAGCAAMFSILNAAGDEDFDGQARICRSIEAEMNAVLREFKPL